MDFMAIGGKVWDCVACTNHPPPPHAMTAAGVWPYKAISSSNKGNLGGMCGPSQVGNFGCKDPICAIWYISF